MIDNNDMNDRQRAIWAWYDSLNEAERVAVDHWLLTGDTSLIDAFKPHSERLQQYNAKRFDPDAMDSYERSQSQRLNLNWDVAKALPIDLLPAFKALSWQEQTRLRVVLWLMPVGSVAAQMGQWITDTLEANPDLDLKTLEKYAHEWMHRPLGEKRPFPGITDSDAFQALWYATGHYRAHKRRKLTAQEVEACTAAIAANIPTADDYNLDVWELEAASVVSAAWGQR